MARSLDGLDASIARNAEFADEAERSMLVSTKMGKSAVSALSLIMLDEKDGPVDESEDQDNKLTFSQALMTLVLNAVGTSILFFPKVMAEVGMVAAPAMCLVCALVCTECGSLIAQSCEMAESITGVAITSYEELADFVGYGKLLGLTKNFAFIGYVIVYFGIVTDSVAQFFPQPVSPSTMTMIRFGITLPMFCVLAMLKNLKQLARFVPVGIVAMLVECSLLVIGGLIIGSRNEACPEGTSNEKALVEGCNVYDLWPPYDGVTDTLGYLGKALSIFLFSYAILATIPSVRSQLQEPAQMPTILRIAFTCCACINISIMSIGYYAFGSNVDDNQNNGFNAYFVWMAQTIAAAVTVNMILSTPLISYCVITVFEATGDDALRTPWTPPNIIFRIVFMCVMAVANFVLPYVMEVIGLISSVFACLNNVMFPLLFYYLARRKMGDKVADDNTGCKRANHVLILIVGLCVMVFGVQGSLNTLLEKLNEES